VACHVSTAEIFHTPVECINVLTSETLTDIGAGATFYACLVEVEKAAELP
jgi:hypothetical protein